MQMRRPCRFTKRRDARIRRNPTCGSSAAASTSRRIPSASTSTSPAAAAVTPKTSSRDSTASCRQTATPATRKYPARHMPSAGHMQGGTSSRPSRQICGIKTSLAASAKKPSSGSTSSLPSTKGLQGSRKKSAKNSVYERAICNFTIGRKNWLFSNSPKGAKASATVYSIIETAKANGLNPFQYLKCLFEHLPNADIQRHPEHLDNVLPWNEIIQQNCK